MANDPFGYYEPGIVFKNYTRDEAERELQQVPGGAYLVRPSSQPSKLALLEKPFDEFVQLLLVVDVNSLLLSLFFEI